MARKTLKRRPQSFTEIKGVGPKRAQQLKDEFGSYQNFANNSSNYLKNRLSSIVSGNRRNLPKFAENAIKAASGREDVAVEAVTDDLVETESTGTTETSGGFKPRSQQRKERVQEGEATSDGEFSLVDQFSDALDAFSEEYQGETTFTGPDPTEIREGVEESAAPDEFVSVVPSAVNQRTFLQFPTEENFEENVESAAGTEDAVEPAKEGFVNYVSQTIGLGGGMRTIGEFEVEEDEYEEAQEEFAQQSPEAKQVDRRRRAPITTNEDVYAQAPGRYDFPGVDTPSSDPQVKQKDSKTVDAEDTTLDSREGSLFIRENNQNDSMMPSLEGVFPTARSAGRGTSEQSASLAESMLGVDTDEKSTTNAVADITFLEREKEGFGETLIPFEAEESDKTRYDFL